MACDFCRVTPVDPCPVCGPVSHAGNTRIRKLPKALRTAIANAAPKPRPVAHVMDAHGFRPVGAPVPGVNSRARYTPPPAIPPAYAGPARQAQIAANKERIAELEAALAAKARTPSNPTPPPPIVAQRPGEGPSEGREVMDLVSGRGVQNDRVNVGAIGSVALPPDNRASLRAAGSCSNLNPQRGIPAQNDQIAGARRTQGAEHVKAAPQQVGGNQQFGNGADGAGGAKARAVGSEHAGPVTTRPAQAARVAVLTRPTLADNLREAERMVRGLLWPKYLPATIDVKASKVDEEATHPPITRGDFRGLWVAVESGLLSEADAIDIAASWRSVAGVPA